MANSGSNQQNYDPEEELDSDFLKSSSEDERKVVPETVKPKGTLPGKPVAEAVRDRRFLGTIAELEAETGKQVVYSDGVEDIFAVKPRAVGPRKSGERKRTAMPDRTVDKTLRVAHEIARTNETLRGTLKTTVYEWMPNTAQPQVIDDDLLARIRQKDEERWKKNETAKQERLLRKKAADPSFVLPHERDQMALNVKKRWRLWKAGLLSSYHHGPNEPEIPEEFRDWDPSDDEALKTWREDHPLPTRPQAVISTSQGNDDIENLAHYFDEAELAALAEQEEQISTQQSTNSEKEKDTSTQASTHAEIKSSKRVEKPAKVSRQPPCPRQIRRPVEDVFTVPGGPSDYEIRRRGLERRQRMEAERVAAEQAAADEEAVERARTQSLPVPRIIRSEYTGAPSGNTYRSPVARPAYSVEYTPPAQEAQTGELRPVYSNEDVARARAWPTYDAQAPNVFETEEERRRRVRDEHQRKGRR
ncbi:hypothetical protein EDC01DRAFT_776575 [Geopyxis carbonaria]|nr:hypothetical protein EDC01DRAFT_776575 [Geopyxis carbonaria]